jgi:hypothetical protein
MDPYFEKFLPLCLIGNISVLLSGYDCASLLGQATGGLSLLFETVNNFKTEELVS